MKRTAPQALPGPARPCQAPAPPENLGILKLPKHSCGTYLEMSETHQAGDSKRAQTNSKACLSYTTSMAHEHWEMDGWNGNGPPQSWTVWGFLAMSLVLDSTNRVAPLLLSTMPQHGKRIKPQAGRGSAPAHPPISRECLSKKSRSQQLFKGDATKLGSPGYERSKDATPNTSPPTVLSRPVSGPSSGPVLGPVGHPLISLGLARSDRRGHARWAETVRNPHLTHAIVEKKGSISSRNDTDLWAVELDIPLPMHRANVLDFSLFWV